HEPRQLVRRPASLGFGGEPVAAQALHLGPGHTAQPGKAVDVLAPAPAILGLGPLRGPLPVAKGRTRLDRRATDAARDRGLDFAADRGDRRLVDLGEALLDIAEMDPRQPL